MSKILDKKIIKHKTDEIRVYLVGRVFTNCYCYISQGEAMVVDPGASGEDIAKDLEGIDVKYIVATHGHGDHVGGALALQANTQAEFLINEKDEKRSSSCS